MIGAGVGVGATVHASVAARVAAAAAGIAIGTSAVEVQAVVADMLDLGLLKDINEDLAYCPAGHAFEGRLGCCPVCGSNPGEPPSMSDFLSQDDEIYRDEERTASEQEYELELIATDEPSFLEKLELALIRSGCPDFESVALAIIPIFDELTADASALRKLAGKVGWSPTTVKCIERAFALIAQIKTKSLKRPIVSRSPADVRIWRDGEHFRWKIVDHLAEYATTGRSGPVNLGGIRFTSHTRAVQLLQERVQRLETLVRVLITRREGFFKAKDPMAAHKVLDEQPLTQKEVCELTGIPPAALSRWCDYKGRKTRTSKKSAGESKGEKSRRTGVEVDTPHGILPLTAFFSVPSRLRGGQNRTQEDVQENIELLLTEVDSQGLQSDAFIQMVREEHGIELAARTVRKIRKKIADTSMAKRPVRTTTSESS